MNTRKLLTVFLGLTLVLSIAAFSAPEATTTANEPTAAIEPTAAPIEPLVRATIKLQILAPYVDVHGNQIVVREDGRDTQLNSVSTGLGTLVNTRDGTYIVTHDHYAQLDASCANVEMTDYTGSEVLLDIVSFRALIRYRNNGVLILDAPVGLPKGVSAGNGEEVEPGAEVQIVHRDADTGRLSIVPAVVERWIDYQGIPSFRLRNLNGEVFRKGNSGGGVWYEGRLVGSIHRVSLDPDLCKDPQLPESLGQPTHCGFATRLSPERISILRPSN
ncbi:MAG: hypothetical protein R6X18_17125 [Chloroflexota bacterium]|jgi:hypothetical protein